MMNDFNFEELRGRGMIGRGINSALLANIRLIAMVSNSRVPMIGRNDFGKYVGFR
jgi:hypothetical protein